MGSIRPVAAVKLFVGILSSVPELGGNIEARLQGVFGPADLRSGSFPFDSTRYYDEEMGTPLHRWFLGFENLIPPDGIAKAKLRTNELESEFQREITHVRRPVNLDPGYLEQSKLVLASTKNFYHRILISDGIYAEVTLHFEGGEWRPFPWTFPDFRTGRYNRFFDELRTAYRAQLRRAEPEGRKPEAGTKG
jgi:hypothetical protein